MGFRFYTFLAACKKSEKSIFQMNFFTVRRQGKVTKGQTETRPFTGTPQYMSHHTINNHISHNHQTTPRYKSSRQ